MEVTHIRHHKEIDGFRIKYDLCIPEKVSEDFFYESKTLIAQDEYELFQSKINDFLQDYSETVEEI